MDNNDDFSNFNKIRALSIYNRTIKDNDIDITISENSNISVNGNITFYKKNDNKYVHIIFDDCEFNEVNIFLDETIYEYGHIKITNIIFNYDFTKIIYDKERNILIFYTNISFNNVLGTKKPIELSIGENVSQPLVLVIDNRCQYKFLNNNDTREIDDLYNLSIIYQQKLNIKFDIDIKAFPRKLDLITDIKCIKGLYKYALLYNCKCEYTNSITFNTNTNVHVFFNECTLSKCNITSNIKINDEHFLKISNINFSNNISINIENNELIVTYHYNYLYDKGKKSIILNISTNENASIYYNNKELNTIKINLINNHNKKDIINFYVNYNSIKSEELIIEIINELYIIYNNITNNDIYIDLRNFYSHASNIKNKIDELVKIKGLSGYNQIKTISDTIYNNLNKIKTNLIQGKVFKQITKANKRYVILTLLDKYRKHLQLQHSPNSSHLSNPQSKVNQPKSSLNPIVQNTGNNSSSSDDESQNNVKKSSSPNSSSSSSRSSSPSAQPKPQSSPIQVRRLSSSSDSDFDYFFLQEQEEELKKKFKTKGGTDSYQNRKASFLKLFSKL